MKCLLLSLLCPSDISSIAIEENYVCHSVLDTESVSLMYYTKSTWTDPEINSGYKRCNISFSHSVLRYGICQFDGYNKN